MSDLEGLSYQDTKRYLGVLEDLYVGLEKHKRSHKKKKRGLRSRYREIFKNAQFWNLLISQAIAETSDLQVCFNNGVIAEVPSCGDRSNNWGFDMAAPLKELSDAGLKSSCGQSPEAGEAPSSDVSGIPSQSCGLFGITKDFTLACSKNNSRDCMKQLDRGALTQLVRGCMDLKKKQGKKGSDTKDKNASAANQPLKLKVSDKVEVDCNLINKHIEEQLLKMTKHCFDEGKVNSSVKNICQRSFCMAEDIAFNELNLKPKEKSEEAASTDDKKTKQPSLETTNSKDKAKNKVLFLGDSHLTYSNFSGALQTCLSEDKILSQQMGVENGTPGMLTGDEAVEGSVYQFDSDKSGIAASCLKSTKGGKEVFDCKPKKQKVKTIKELMSDESNSPETTVLLFGDSFLKDGKLNAAEMEAQYKKMLLQVKERNKKCVVLTPPLPVGESKNKTSEHVKQMNEIIKKINVSQNSQGQSEAICHVIDSSDLLQAQRESEKPHLKSVEGGNGINLGEEDYKAWAKGVCDEVKKIEKPQSVASQRCEPFQQEFNQLDSGRTNESPATPANKPSNQ